MTVDDGKMTPQYLKYLFGSLKPSERAVLERALRNPETRPRFDEALLDFLEGWQTADWFEEYNVLRVGLWIHAKLPLDLRDHVRNVVQAAKRHSGHAHSPYDLLLSGLDGTDPLHRASAAQQLSI
jgi:hypothetical protein